MKRHCSGTLYSVLCTSYDRALRVSGRAADSLHMFLGLLILMRTSILDYGQIYMKNKLLGVRWHCDLLIVRGGGVKCNVLAFGAMLNRCLMLYYNSSLLEQRCRIFTSIYLH